MNISYDWYKIFCCAAECKSITIAAEKLFISQPAVSQTIKQLEETLSAYSQGRETYRRGRTSI